jgi:hypothetical protein
MAVGFITEAKTRGGGGEEEGQQEVENNFGFEASSI